MQVRQIVSAAALEQALATRDTSAARLALAAAQLSLITAPPRAEDAAIAKANVEAARARIEEIKASIEKTIIRSPIDGVILKLYRRKGETVSNLPPTPIAAIGDTTRLRVRADVDQADVANVAPGEAVSVTADAFGNKRFHGTVVQLGAQLGRKTFRTDAPEERIDTKILEVLIDLEPGARLPIGLPVDVVIDRAVRPTPQISSEIHPEEDASALPVTPRRLVPEMPITSETASAAAQQVAKVAFAAPHQAGIAMVQIGSYATADLAKRAWAEFSAKHTAMVAGSSPDIREANLGDRTLYRLRFGPLSNAAAASRCEELKGQGTSCLVAAS